MSKKKNKFKKNKKHQPENITVERASIEISNPTGEPLTDSKPSILEPVLDEKEHHYKTDKYDHVKKDINKILIIMFLIVLALVGVYILSLQTTLFDVFGSWVYKVLNITTG